MDEHPLDRFANAFKQYQLAAQDLRDNNEFLQALTLLMALELDQERTLANAARAVMAHVTPQTPAGREACRHYQVVKDGMRRPEELVDLLPDHMRELMRQFLEMRAREVKE